MHSISFNKTDKIISGEINLPASKSITNRALILNFLTGNNFSILNQSLAEDSVVLDNILKKLKVLSENQLINEIDVDNAGTVMRFLTSLLAITKGDWILTGSERMKERPLVGLVDALNKLGAKISYKDNYGFPPLLIKGQIIEKGEVNIDVNTSSQFVTSLLLIAIFFEGGLKLNFKGEAVSKPYIIMTLKILDFFGIKYTFIGNSIAITKQFFKPKNILIESDWSAASYWYEIAAFSKNVDLKLIGLTKNGWQGDSIIAEIFHDFGVETEFLSDGVRITNTKSTIKDFHFDFTHYPDIAQTVAVTCAGLGINANLTGLESLKIKECNRLNALEKELVKLGCHVKCFNNNSLNIQTSGLLNHEIINTYNDHRMAMSFAPLAIINHNIKLDKIEVVKKSYPYFWKDLRSIDFVID